MAVLQIRKFANRRIRKGTVTPGARDHRPKATVIVPFKGIDVDLPGCIRSLCTQDHPDYSLVFVVESEDDPAYPVLREQIARYPDREVKLHVAGVATKHEGQKVHNQRSALATLTDDADDDAWVFADSDSVPGPDWLGHMVGPLVDQRIGMTTGYRWLIPPASGASVWDHLASVMNSSVACLLGRKKSDCA